jgi:hypothetical protein
VKSPKDFRLRVGWLADEVDTIVGGAELCVEELFYAKPEEVEIVPCRPPVFEEPDVDMYVVHNCTQYHVSAIGSLAKRPTIKLVYEYWYHGNKALREWLLANATLLLFLGEPHRNSFPHIFTAPSDIMPTIVTLEPFRQAVTDQRMSFGLRQGTIWIAQMTGDHKGIPQAVKWAEEHQEVVHFYGGGPPHFRPWNYATQPGVYALDMGQLPYPDVPRTMAKYAKFLFLPTELDSCSRTVFEAWASGLEMVINDFCGAQWWIDERPEDIERGKEMFWNHVLEVANSVQKI